jgi:hypothetical protein
MKRIVTALLAAVTIATMALASSGTAEARWVGGWHGGWRGGWHRGWGPGPFIGGLAAGAIIGGALAAPYYYPYGYYGPYPYGPCVWRTVWNGYRWVRACY